MSEKPKVYQGVRVKATVRELLQKRRALQAIQMETIFQDLTSREVCSTSSPGACSGNSTLDNNVQPSHCVDNVCNYPTGSCEFDDLQLMNAVIHTEDFTNSSSPPPPISQPLSLGGYRSNTEYNCQTWASCSNADSRNLHSPVNYNSYSTPGYPSSSSPSCYSYTMQTDSSHDLSHGNCNFQHYSLPHWADSSDSGSSLEYAPHSMSEWWYTSTVDQSYLRTNITSPDMYQPFSTQTGVL